jgi:hypothetical protein
MIRKAVHHGGIEINRQTLFAGRFAHERLTDPCRRRGRARPDGRHLA